MFKLAYREYYLDREEELATFLKFQETGDKRLRDKLWLHLAHYAETSLIRGKFSSQEEFDLSVSNLLILADRCIEKYDPSKGWRLLSYFSSWTKRVSNYANSDFEKVVSVPKNVQSKLPRANIISLKLFGHSLSNCSHDELEEIADQFGQNFDTTKGTTVRQLSGKQLKAAISSQFFESFDAPSIIAGQESNLTLHDLVAASDDQEKDYYEHLERIRKMFHLVSISKVPPRNKMAWLFHNFTDATLLDIGELFGISRERIRQVCDKITENIVRKIEIPSKNNAFKDFTYEQMVDQVNRAYVEMKNKYDEQRNNFEWKVVTHEKTHISAGSGNMPGRTGICRIEYLT